MSPLTTWANFYVIVGSSAGALAGLTFVVITLVAGRHGQGTSWGVATFTTPTVVHFATVLLVSAILSAPWPSLVGTAFLLGITGLAGIAYSGIVVRRLRRRIRYQPVLEDWLWFAAMPLIGYTALIVMALLLPRSPTPALFGIGAVVMLILFLGIRNAWDVVTYIAVEQDNHSGERNAERERNE